MPGRHTSVQYTKTHVRVYSVSKLRINTDTANENSFFTRSRLFKATEQYGYSTSRRSTRLPCAAPTSSTTYRAHCHSSDLDHTKFPPNVMLLLMRFRNFRNCMARRQKNSTRQNCIYQVTVPSLLTTKFSSWNTSLAEIQKLNDLHTIFTTLHKHWTLTRSCTFTKHYFKRNKHIGS